MCAVDPSEESFATPAAVTSIVDSSLVGEQLFKSSVLLIVQRRVPMLVRDRWDAWSRENKLKKFTEEDYNTMVSECVDAVLREPAGSSLEWQRKVSVQFRGVELQDIDVAGICDEVEIRVYCLVKASAIANAQLDAMSFETLLGCVHDEGIPSPAIDGPLLYKAIIF